MKHSINGTLVRTPNIATVFSFDNGWSAMVFCQNVDDDCILRIPTNTANDINYRLKWVSDKVDEVTDNGTPANTEFVTLGLVTGDNILAELARIAALPPIDDAAKGAKIADDLLSKIRKR